MLIEYHYDNQPKIVRFLDKYLHSLFLDCQLENHSLDSNNPLPPYLVEVAFGGT